MPLGIPMATCCGQKWLARLGLRSAIKAELIARLMHSPTLMGRTSGAPPGDSGMVLMGASSLTAVKAA
eukprot:7527037-Karenia_brevis.AAC.1